MALICSIRERRAFRLVERMSSHLILASSTSAKELSWPEVLTFIVFGEVKGKKKRNKEQTDEIVVEAEHAT
jgi:hypothetical protein